MHVDFLQIKDFHVAQREEDIGYYAGYVGEHILYTHNINAYGYLFLGVLFEALIS